MLRDPKEPPLISFVTHIYHRPELLRVFISALLAQDEQNWECVIADEDADRNWPVIERLIDERFIHVPMARVSFYEGYKSGTLGLVPKHNGSKYASGKYLCFASDDIYLMPSFVRILGNNDEDIVGCDILFNMWKGSIPVYFAPAIGLADTANYIIKPEWYAKHPFTESIVEAPRGVGPYRFPLAGTADGRTPMLCVRDGATWKRIPRVLSIHGVERPDEETTPPVADNYY